MMELRVLEYFLAIAREQSISKAAETLHLSQPTLSRQIKDMEEELGKQLIIRGNRRITLTEEGMILRKRAEEIISLVRITEDEIIMSDEEIIQGDLSIGTGESESISSIAKIVKKMQEAHPNIRCHLISGNSVQVTEQLDRGLIDFGILFEPCDLSKYEFIKLPFKDTWGVLMPKDSPLASKEFITPDDLKNQPLILSSQQTESSSLFEWLRADSADLNIKATYTLINNGALLVKEGLGYALCLDKLINVTGDSNLCFVPLLPKLEISLYVAWKKYQIFTKVGEKFLTMIQDQF